MSLFCTQTLGPCSNQQALSRTQSFVSALKDFKKISKQLPIIQEPLKILEEAFTQEVKLQHPRQVYPLYEALTLVTNEVAKKCLNMWISQGWASQFPKKDVHQRTFPFPSLSDKWHQVLKTLDNRRVYRVGLGWASFDTSIAQKILTKKLDGLQKTIVASPVDVKNIQNRQEVVDYIYKTDREAFGACFQRGFLEEILKSDKVRCLAARDENNEIVGILWGFLTHYQNHQLFHFWELSRKASMAHMGIAKKLINCAKEQQRLYPGLKFATLNVDVDNKHAKEIYDSEHFAALTEEKKAVKIFMTNKLTSDTKICGSSQILGHSLI
jgi:ribosomal protein S18 acetylase RimI-like enzyme